MRKFRNIEFEIIQDNYNGFVRINLKQIKHLVEVTFLMESKSIIDYRDKIKELSSDIDNLGEFIYNEDEKIMFSYKSGFVSNKSEIAILINSSFIKSSEYKYTFLLDNIKLRELKINLLLNGIN